MKKRCRDDDRIKYGEMVIKSKKMLYNYLIIKYAMKPQTNISWIFVSFINKQLYSVSCTSLDGTV